MQEPILSKSKFILRVVYDAFLLASLLYFPWWFTAVLAVFSLFYFRNFYETIIIGALADMIYGIPRKTFFNLEAVNTVLALIAYAGAYWLKGFLRRESVMFIK